MIFTSTVVSSLKKTLNKVAIDVDHDIYANTVWSDWLESMTMDEAYDDDLGIAGMGLMAEVPEESEIPSGNIKEDYLTRYRPKKVGRKLPITEEAVEDCLYPKIVKMTQYLHRAAWKTVEVDTTRILSRMFNTSYVGGDGLPLISASHTLPNGGTYSNLAANAALSESQIASIRTQAAQMPGRDGITDGCVLKKLVVPSALWMFANQLTGSQYTPESNNFAKINTVQKLKLTIVENPYWQNTSSNYLFLTDAEGGPNIRWRRKFKSATWKENSREIMFHSMVARYAMGWTNPRSAIGCAN